jgi:hypothetical protein
MSEALKSVLSIRQLSSVSCSGSVPICPTSSSILILPMCVALNFWKLMPCLEEFRLLAGIPRCIRPFVPHSEPRMGSRMILVLVLGD